MDESESQICFKRSVRFLFQVYKFFGLVSFTYDRATNRVYLSSHNECRFIRALGCCCFSNLVVSVFTLWELPFSTFVKLEELLLTVRMTLMTTNAVVLSISYITHRRTIAKTLNRLIALSERIQRLTNDGSLYYPGSFRKVIIIRLMLFFAIGLTICCSFDPIDGILFGVWFQHALTLMELTFWAHLYGNLTLICFYQKMNNLLSVLCATTRDEAHVKRRIRKMISISYEIHRVKEKFNEVFSTFHLVYFLGFFTDTHMVYDLLRVLVSVELGKVRLSLREVLGLICLIVFGKSLALHNLHLNSHVAERLLHAEKSFRQKLLTMFYANAGLRDEPDQRREIDLVVMHHNIQDLATRSFVLFVINHRFLWGFITEIVIFYAIVSFQQFIGEFVTASGERLEILLRSVTHN